MKLIVLGLPASGKTSVLKEFEEKKFRTINSDLLVEKIYLKKRIQNKLVELFGEKIVVNNKVDKKKLGELVFSDFEKLFELSLLIHPVVLSELEKKLNAVRSSVVFEVPVLLPVFEHEFLKLSDGIVLVETRKKIRFERLKKKYGLKQARERIKLKTVDKKTIFNSGKPVFKVSGNSFETIKRDVNKIIMD